VKLTQDNTESQKQERKQVEENDAEEGGEQIERLKTEDIDISNWKTYRNEEYGFEIQHPNDLKVLYMGINSNELDDFKDGRDKEVAYFIIGKEKDDVKDEINTSVVIEISVKDKYSKKLDLECNLGFRSHMQMDNSVKVLEACRSWEGHQMFDHSFLVVNNNDAYINSQVRIAATLIDYKMYESFANEIKFRGLYPKLTKEEFEKVSVFFEEIDRELALEDKIIQTFKFIENKD
jgi:hypothetical protein